MEVEAAVVPAAVVAVASVGPVELAEPAALSEAASPTIATTSIAIATETAIVGTEEGVVAVAETAAAVAAAATTTGRTDRSPNIHPRSLLLGGRPLFDQACGIVLAKLSRAPQCAASSTSLGWRETS